MQMQSSFAVSRTANLLILQCGCGDLCSFSHKSIGDVKEVKRSGVQLALRFNQNEFSKVEGRALCRTLEFFQYKLGKQTVSCTLMTQAPSTIIDFFFLII